MQKKLLHRLNFCFLCLLNLCENLFLEEFLGGIGRYGMLLAVYGDVNAVYAVTHAESATEFYLIFEVVFLYERLKLFHDLAGTFQMT